MDLYAGSRPLARLGQRYVASLIDGLIFLALFGALLVGGLIVDSSPSFVLGVVVVLVAETLYETIFVARRGQTPGKRLVGIRVVMFHGGGRPPFAAATTRAIIKLLFGLPGGSLLMGASVVFGLNSRAPHDRIAGTVVVQDR